MGTAEAASGNWPSGSSVRASQSCLSWPKVRRGILPSRASLDSGGGGGEGATWAVWRAVGRSAVESRRSAGVWAGHWSARAASAGWWSKTGPALSLLVGAVLLVNRTAEEGQAPGRAGRTSVGDRAVGRGHAVEKGLRAGRPLRERRREARSGTRRGGEGGVRRRAGPGLDPALREAHPGGHRPDVRPRPAGRAAVPCPA